MSTVTIVPEQCQKCVACDANWLQKFGRPCSAGPMRCDACRPLGDELAALLYEDFRGPWQTLVANLVLASLLCSAEERGVAHARRRYYEREARRLERAGVNLL